MRERPVVVRPEFGLCAHARMQRDVSDGAQPSAVILGSATVVTSKSYPASMRYRMMGNVRRRS